MLLFCPSERVRDTYFEKVLLTQVETIERCSEKVGEKRSAAGVSVGVGWLPVNWGGLCS